MSSRWFTRLLKGRKPRRSWAAKYVTDWHSATPTQAALAVVIDEELLARHVRWIHREYQARHGRIAELLARVFAGIFTPVRSEPGCT
jgi:GntR family transcriptional regulator/MocR family aminotransferase